MQNSSLLRGNLFLRSATWASIWSENFHTLRSNHGRSCSFKLLGSNSHGPSGEGLGRGKWKRSITTKVEENKDTQSSKFGNLRHELLDGTVSTSTKLHIKEPQLLKFERTQYSDIQQTNVDIKEMEQLLTIFVFDIETTGFSRQTERIIEFALQDLLGGENSTFQTLVNPERYVLNSHVHGITTKMVNRPDVPRMEDLIPILKDYVRSRQKPGGVVLWVAHNARVFDVPFLINEFSRCSYEIPSDWLFLDTLPLARLLMKSNGSKLSSTSQQALREYYELPLVGSAHRAMSDVKILSQILQKLTFDLKLPVSELLERSFKTSDLTQTKKKKKTSS
ncbi:hypothetical protein NE237_015913 [Protea cynaroides]|uniref:Exonuclease domain-containing protein n=1 Tax=Protea cynaroides TaxID=273540 RepID=A0A9Q0KEW7_9MAGN|nr:hypothetical protein NE237_015913 [Protea cynaroides]